MAGTIYYNLEDIRSLNASNVTINNNNEKFESQKTKFETFKLVIKYIIISLCTCLCCYLLFERVEYYVKYETTVSVNVKIVSDLRNILPGITVCSGSFLSLKSLVLINPQLGDDLEAVKNKNMSFEDEYAARHGLISKAVESHLSSLPLSSYFDPKNGLVTSKQLITELICDRQTWMKRQVGKRPTSSLFDTCDNVFKIRSIDKLNGMCFTLFHESSLIALQTAARESFFGRDEIISEDPEVTGNMMGVYQPPQFPGNGLMRLRLNYNFENMKVGPNQSTNLNFKIGGKFWIHPNRVVPKMSAIGYHLRPGRKYTIFIRKLIDNLMKPPYVTMCHDYAAAYADSMKGRKELMDLSLSMSREGCIDECIAKNAVENTTHCGCWPTALPFRKVNQTENSLKLKFCDEKKSEICFTMFEPKCRSKCPRDCKYEYYETTVMEQQNPSKSELEYLFAKTPRELWQKKIYKKLNLYQPETIIEVVFASNEETHHDHSAALEIINLVVDMAGLFGLFLSLSAVQLIDLYEYVRDRKRNKVQVANSQ